MNAPTAICTAAERTTILAIDFGKYKSVACAHDHATGEICFTTFETTRHELQKLLARWQPAAVIMLDPNTAFRGKGERLIRDHGIVVDRFPHDLIVRLEELNRDFTRGQSRA